ncbi:MAG: PorV/PorQ family protein [Bacteroidia bacterium]|nr:PorV/PorQ family protein [Bacteroidia bacterium]
MILKKIKYIAFLTLIATSTFAGNRDRSGQSGAGELLFNPWARSSGLFGLNGSYVSGIEAMKLNIAGLAKTERTDVGIAHTRYLSGTGMSISNVGIAQNVGDVGVIGVNIMSFGFGEIPITTETSPEGGIGNYKPSFLNFSVGLGHSFSKNMSAGFSATYVSEAISNISASAIAFDAGVQYSNGKRNNLHIGIALRNIGTNLRFSGDGFSFNGTSPDFAKQLTVQSRSEKASLPSQLNIATSYDFYLDEKKVGETENPQHRLSAMASFISNAFNNDWIGVGLEYSFKEKFMLRAAYRYENGITNKDKSTTLYTGLSAGASFQTKLSNAEKAHAIAFEYAFKPTNIAGGVHVLGIKLNLAKQSD